MGQNENHIFTACSLEKYSGMDSGDPSDPGGICPSCGSALISP
jgi:hypothetical protein